LISFYEIIITNMWKSLIGWRERENN